MSGENLISEKEFIIFVCVRMQSPEGGGGGGGGVKRDNPALINGFECFFGSWGQPRSPCGLPPADNPHRPESHQATLPHLSCPQRRSSQSFSDMLVLRKRLTSSELGKVSKKNGCFKTSCKKMFSFGHCPKRGGGPCPNFLALFLTCICPYNW